jgi:hypothetical protein
MANYQATIKGNAVTFTRDGVKHNDFGAAYINEDGEHKRYYLKGFRADFADWKGLRETPERFASNDTFCIKIFSLAYRAVFISPGEWCQLASQHSRLYEESPQP